MLALRRRFGLALGFGAMGFLVFCAAQVVNHYREPWLGVVPGNAANNFGFNLAFYIPATLLSSSLALISVIFYVRSLRALRRNNAHPSLAERATILPSAPILMFDTILGWFIVQIVLTS
jgi:hypothetical protein